MYENLPKEDDDLTLVTRFTTPTFTFTFEDLDVSTITVAELTVKQDRLVIERNINTAVIDEESISWTLSQEETGKLTAWMKGEAKCDWVTTSGIRGISETLKFKAVNAGKNEVLSNE